MVWVFFGIGFDGQLSDVLFYITLHNYEVKGFFNRVLSRMILVLEVLQAELLMDMLN